MSVIRGTNELAPDCYTQRAEVITMSSKFVTTFLAILLFSLVSRVMAQTQPTAEIVAGPIPPQLVNAKRVFVANGAGDNDPGITKYTSGPDGLYNQFYADVKSLGRYDMAASPADADIALELKVDYAVYNHDFTYPKFKVEVRDPKTNVLLWSFMEPVNGAFLAKTGRKNVSQALGKLADDLKKIGTAQ
jgi:hypothetical protein